MEVSYFKYPLQFIRPAGTSRGIMLTKTSWFFRANALGRIFLGECGLLEPLSSDPLPEYEGALQRACKLFHLPMEELYDIFERFPSIVFGIEQLKRALENEHPAIFFSSDFTKGDAGLRINGLIWMGSCEEMSRQIEEKIRAGFGCIKVKIGALDFQTEYELLQGVRKRYPQETLEIRVDANGAFHPEDALAKLEKLSALGIHSIEQPIAAGQWEDMARLCRESPLPIALDEELIGVPDKDRRESLLQAIRPHYLIIKPSLVGGYKHAQQWIDLAKAHRVGWWVTSALESSVGLSAIAQWTYTLHPAMAQGLGTGRLYCNNFPSPLTLNGELLSGRIGSEFNFM